MADTLFQEIFDDSQILAALNRIEGGLNKLESTGKDLKKQMDSTFSPDAALGVTDALKELQNKYLELKTSATTLKTALKGATDPQTIKLYTSSIAQLEGGMKQLEKAGSAAGLNMKKLSQEANVGKEVFGQLFGQFTKAGLIVGAIQLVAELTKKAVTLSAEVSKASKSFESFLGDAEKAKKIVGELTSFASAKFLDQGEVFKAGKALLAFGESADNITKVLSRTADISAATGKNFNELVTIYGKARTSGVLYAEDINQLVDAGIPIIQEFAKQMGVSNDKVKKLASEGKISFEELQLAFFNLTATGGKFFGQVGAQTETLSGQFDKLTNNFYAKLKSIGDAFQPILTGAVKLLNTLLDSDPTGGLVKAKQKQEGQVKKVYQELLGIETEGQENILRVNKTNDAERAKLEADAAKRRKELAGKSNQDAAKLEAERQKLLIEAMKEGEAREIAEENLRFKELAKELRKFHIDTSQAEEQHQKNISEIRTKYYVERLQKQIEAIEQEQEAVKRGFDELGRLEAQQTAERASGLAKSAEAQKQAAALQKELFEQGLLAAREAFFSTKRTDEEKKQYEKDVAKARELFQLAQQKAELERTLTFDTKLSDAEKVVLRQRIDNITAEIGQITAGVGTATKKPFSLLSLIGLDPEKDKEKIEGAKLAIQETLDIISQSNQAEIERQQAIISAIDDRIAKQEEAVTREAELAKAGLANDLSTEKKRLSELKAQREAAAKEEAKAKRAAIILDSIAQVSNLITASTKIFNSLAGIPFVGVPLAIGLIAAMFGAFIAAKSRALKAAEAPPKFREGGKLPGRKHEQGGTPIIDRQGYQIAEGEEGEYLLPVGPSKEHEPFLDRMRKGEFRGVNLDALIPYKSKYVNPTSEAVTRIKDIEQRRAELTDARHWAAMKAAYSHGAERIVNAIEAIPEITPLHSYRRRVKRGNLTEVVTVNKTE